MIKFEDFSFGFPEKELYEDINVEIETGDHLVLIGSNGCGKSTLVNLLLHEERYTYEGRIRRPKDLRIGYVSQFVEASSREGTVTEFLEKPFVEILQKNDQLCGQMAEGEDLEQIYEEYQKLCDEMDAMDAYNYQSNIAKALAAAGLDHLADRKVTQLSGGEYKLLFVMRNMLLMPQLLIMDEPDVFLDFENLLALIKLINSYDGTLLTITHNRLLLTGCFDKIWDVENKSIREFPGNFADYNTWMLQTKLEIFEHVRDFDEFIEKQQEIVRKVRRMAEMTTEPQYGRQLKARATYIERLKKMRGDDPFLEEHHHEFVLWLPEEEEALPVEVQDYTLSYEGEEPLLEQIFFSLAPGEKVAIVGPNGTGKSSMMRDLYEKLWEEHGETVGYFRQIIEADEALRLSGGERNLAQLQELCSRPHKLLLLDEPTSHLDIYAQIELEKALRKYKGTILMVSHDLFAVAGVCDRVLLLEDGSLREMSGRAYRKSIYKNYFSADIFEAERKRIDTEIRASDLLRAGKYKEARTVLGMPPKKE